MFVEWMKTGKPTVLGAISGAVAGLVVITPASGFTTPMYAILMGAIGGIVCFFAATVIKHMFNYDDSLDAFGVHGVGGTLGAILTGPTGVGPCALRNHGHRIQLAADAGMGGRRHRGGAIVGDQFSLLEHADAIRERERLAHVVRDDDHGLAQLRLDAAKLAGHGQAGE